MPPDVPGAIESHSFGLRNRDDVGQLRNRVKSAVGTARPPVLPAHDTGRGG